MSESKHSRALSNNQIKYRPWKHGQARSRQLTPLYRAWASMIARCHTRTATGYENYGKRGISVCAAWRESFEAFAADVGPRPSEKHSIDRFPDPNGNYEPGNVRWATRGEQSRNTRRTVMVTINGETLCLKDWAERLRISYATVVNRRNKGWTSLQALGIDERDHIGNKRHNRRVRLTPEAVRQIRMMASAGATGKGLAAVFGVTPTCISSVVRGKTWRNVDGRIATN